MASLRLAGNKILEAEAICRQILNIQPENRDALNIIYSANLMRSLHNFGRTTLESQEKQLMLSAKLLVDRAKKLDCRINISDAEFKVFSQNGEDGIIQFIINNINIDNDSFIEFGVQNYMESNTRFLLMNNNWKGLIIDGDQNNINFFQKPRYELEARYYFCILICNKR